MEPIVHPRWLLARMYEPDLVIVDCRYDISVPSAGRAAYDRDHIPGAVYADLERDLSGPPAVHGGRHPLPDPQTFADTISRLGIDHETRVVAYDDQGGALAARFWWLMRYHGHTQTYILDGGYSYWRSLGYPVSDAHPPVIVPKRFEVRIREEMLADRQEVYERLYASNTVLLDSREAKRFLGVEEPMDPTAGHIPGAVHAYWRESLDDAGLWKSPEEQRERFAAAGIDPDQEIIVYCGSGVTACANVLALERAGFRKVRLYAGSWSDWISYKDRPIAKGE